MTGASYFCAEFFLSEAAGKTNVSRNNWKNVRLGLLGIQYKKNSMPYIVKNWMAKGLRKGKHNSNQIKGDLGSTYTKAICLLQLKVFGKLKLRHR